MATSGAAGVGQQQPGSSGGAIQHAALQVYPGKLAPIGIFLNGSPLLDVPFT